MTGGNVDLPRSEKRSFLRLAYCCSVYRQSSAQCRVRVGSPSFYYLSRYWPASSTGQTNSRRFFLDTVPKEVKNRWEPTPRWQLCFDVTALLLLIGSLIFAIEQLWLPTVSFGFSGFFLALFNRSRLDRIRSKLRRD